MAIKLAPKKAFLVLVICAAVIIAARYKDIMSSDPTPFIILAVLGVVIYFAYQKFGNSFSDGTSQTGKKPSDENW